MSVYSQNLRKTMNIELQMRYQQTSNHSRIKLKAELFLKPFSFGIVSERSGVLLVEILHSHFTDREFSD